MQPLIVFATFVDKEGKALETKPFRVAEGMNPKSKAVPLKLTIPVDMLPNGEYVCQITALDHSTEKAAFWQAPVRIVH